MGSGENKSGLMSSKWMTVVLIAVLVILVAVLVWVLKDPRGFERFKKKRTHELKPSAPTLQRLQNPNERLELASVDDRLRVIAELSWLKDICPPLV